MHFLIPFLRTEMVSGSSSQGKREEEAGRAPKDGGGGAMKRILALALLWSGHTPILVLQERTTGAR